eukprot:scaffold12543_cov115-Isochrysis_galbana.AAC.14
MAKHTGAKDLGPGALAERAPGDASAVAPHLGNQCVATRDEAELETRDGRMARANLDVRIRRRSMHGRAVAQVVHSAMRLRLGVVYGWLGPVDGGVASVQLRRDVRSGPAPCQRRNRLVPFWQG